MRPSTNESNATDVRASATAERLDSRGVRCFPSPPTLETTTTAVHGPGWKFPPRRGSLPRHLAPTDPRA